MNLKLLKQYQESICGPRHPAIPRLRRCGRESVTVPLSRVGLGPWSGRHSGTSHNRRGRGPAVRVRPMMARAESTGIVWPRPAGGPGRGHGRPRLPPAGPGAGPQARARPEHHWHAAFAGFSSWPWPKVTKVKFISQSNIHDQDICWS